MRLFRRHRTPKATVVDPPRRIRLQTTGGVEAEIRAPFFAFRQAMADQSVVTVLIGDDQLVVNTATIAFARPVP